MNVRPRSLVLPVTALIVGAIVAGNAIAARAPLGGDQMVSAKRGTQQCMGWTQPLPALPKTCAAPPTVQQCSDGAFYKTPCGQEKDVQGAFCQKALVDDFCKDKTGEELVFPAGNNKLSAISSLAGKPGSLYVPPGTILLGKQAPHVPRPDKGDKPPPANAQNGQIPLSQTGGVTGITVRSSGQGTYTSSLLQAQVGRYNLVRSTTSTMHLGALAGRSLVGDNDALFGLLSADAEQWVGDGTDTAAHRAVDSCAEYAFQRWYDFTHFKNEARALSRNYRAVYNLAFDPKSDVNLEKATLKQFAVGTLPST
jgi:hypothetical protein